MLSVVNPTSFEGVSKEDIKYAQKHHYHNICTNSKCLANSGSTDVEFKRCSNCKDVWYCSKECQKADCPMPKHKQGCHPSQASRIKTIRSLISNHHLRLYLEVLTIAKLGILDDPSPAKKYHALIFFGIEPSNTKAFSRLFDPSAKVDDHPMKGMLQIYAVFSDPLPRVISEIPWLSPAHHELWHSTRRLADENGLQTDPICIIQWVSLEHALTQTITTNVHITKAGMDLARWHMTEPTPTITIPNVFSDKGPEVFKAHFSLGIVIDYINAKIRQDTTNQWLLRTPMSKRDKEIIVEAARQSSSDHSLQFFGELQRKKASAEAAYAETLQYCGKQDEVIMQIKTSPYPLNPVEGDGDSDTFQALFRDSSTI